MTTKAKAPRRVKQRQREDVPTLLSWLKDGVLDLERAVAAYNKLSGALATAMGQAPDDREQGLPIFTFKATADGVHVLEVVVDLKDVDPKYLEHVLVPLCNAQAGRMGKALHFLVSTVGELQSQIGVVAATMEEVAADESMEEDESS